MCIFIYVFVSIRAIMRQMLSNELEWNSKHRKYTYSPQCTWNYAWVHPIKPSGWMQSFVRGFLRTETVKGRSVINWQPWGKASWCSAAEINHKLKSLRLSITCFLMLLLYSLGSVALWIAEVAAILILVLIDCGSKTTATATAMLLPQ